MSDALGVDGAGSQVAGGRGTGPDAGGRIASVDVLRGLTILVMIFVNDLGRGAPSWMHHIQPTHADGMTLADVVFPTFLFIVGVSIPLAFERAFAAGKSRAAEVGHILLRSALLLCMGVIYMNYEEDRSPDLPIWGSLALSGLVLMFCVVPRERGGKRNLLIALKILGGVGLLVSLARFRGEAGPAEFPIWGRVENWVWLRTGWWGILGLIGWAYLAVALLNLLLGRRREWLMGALGILILLHLALNHGGLFLRLDGKPWLGESRKVFVSLAHGMDDVAHYVSVRDALGSLAAITIAGCLLGTILRRDSDVSTQRARLSWAMTFVVGLFLAGLVTDTFEGINKIAATPSWCLWSAAIATTVWILLYLILDVAGFRVWSILFRLAGANPLVAYFLHPIAIWLISYAGIESRLLAYKESADPWVVVGGSLGMAVAVCTVAGLLGRLGLRMRL